MPTTVDLPEGADAAFSFELTQDQRDIRDWIHGFAENVVRPAASEWDEREETPWPVIQEAAAIGLYGFEGLAQFYADPSGLTLAIANEELFWGDAGIAMAIMGTSLAVASIFASGTPEQMGEWIPTGGIAGVHVVVAAVDRELGARGQAAFVVPPGTPGLQ